MKERILCSCGHTIFVELEGDEKTKDSKRKWYTTVGMCRDCYAKQRKETKQQEGLILHVDLLPFAAEKPILISADGNYEAYKDQLIAGGYHWGDVPNGGVFGGLTVAKYMGYYTRVEYDQMHTAIAALMPLAPTIDNRITENDENMYRELQGKREQKRIRYRDAVDSLSIPQKPELIAGHFWNGKVYTTRFGNSSIYLGNKKVDISKEQAKELENYANEYQAYIKAKEELKIQYLG